MLKQFAKIITHCGKRTPITYHLSLITAVMLGFAGCGTIYPNIDEGSYLTYDHAFSDAAAQAVFRSAEKICAERKRIVIKSSSTCSLTECTTHYLCVDQKKNLGV